MSEQSQASTDPEQIEARVRETVSQGARIREEVEQITVAALRERRLEARRVQEVVESALRGATQGAAEHRAQAQEALNRAVGGVEDALMKSAEASRLAIQEAAGRMEEFSQQDLRKAFEDMRQLDDIMLASLEEVSRAGRDTASQILHDMADHARNSGTEIGRYLDRSLAGMKQDLPHAAREAIEAGTEMTRQGSAQIAAMAAGFLSGLAQGLRPPQGESRGRQEDKPDEG